MLTGHKPKFVSHTVFSGAVGEAGGTKSQLTNKKNAFVRMAQSQKFKIWHKMEVSKRLGQLESIESVLDKEMVELNLKIEYLNSIK